MIRRLASAAVAALAVAATSVAAIPAPAGAADTPAEFVLGSAASSGGVARARLFYGGLSLPMGIGTTSASYTNQQSRALGVALDLGAYIGLAADVPPQFQPTVIDSNKGDKEAHGNLNGGEAVARINLKATRVPAASSEVRMTDLDLPALVRVEGAHVLSTTEVRGAKQRRAETVTTIAKVSVASGLVVLENLVWTATQRTGFEPTAVANFSIGGLKLAGLPVPIAGGDLNTALGRINALLKPVGLRMEAPKLNKSVEGAIGMSPLRVALADSPLGAQLLGPIIASARPLLAPVLDQATDLNKTLGLVGLVADIVLGVADGSGGAEVTLGGATAITAASAFVAPSVPLDVPVAPVVLPDASVGATSPLTNLGDTLAPLKDSALGETPVVTTESVRCALEAAPRRNGDCRSGNLALAVGITGVAAIGLAAAEFGVRRRRRSGDATAVVS